MDKIFKRPPCAENGGCCFKCVSGLCPYGYDPEECYIFMTKEQRQEFKELLSLRAECIRAFLKI